MPAERLKVIRSNALDSATFNYKNLDVGMTRHAASAFVAVGALGWACIRFKLNAGYIVLFLLSFLIVASSWMAYFTLRRLKFQLGHTNNVFAGQPAIYNVTVQAPKRGGIRRNIDLFLGQTHQRTTLNPGESATLTLSHIAAGRGRGQTPIFLIQTVQPFGLWRIKGHWQPTSNHWVYPRPESNAPKATRPIAGGGEGKNSRPGNDTVSGLRPYARGDSPRRISWRALARSDGQVLASKQLESQESEMFWLTDEQAFAGTGETESMLSRLTAWVLEAHSKGWVFGLRLGGKEIAPAHSPAHLEQCLQALASHGIETTV